MESSPEEIRSEKIDKWDAAAYLRKRIPQSNYNRRAFDRIFFRNALFQVGQQWIRYNRQSSQWQPISVPDWFPKQTTNKFAVCVDSMKSILDQCNPAIIYQPSTADEKDIAASQAAQGVSDVIDEEVGQRALQNELAAWVALTGNGFVIDGYNNDKKHGTRFIPSYVCLQCMNVSKPSIASKGCPKCGPSAPMTEAKNPDGHPIGEEISIGRMDSEVASPFEIHFDMQSQTLSNAPYIYRARTYPIEMLKQLFPEFKDKIKPDDAGIDSGMFYQSALSYITNATSSTPGNYGGSVGSADNVPRATLHHLWVRPCPDLPNGGEALVIGSTTVWKSELTKHDEKGNPIVPIQHFLFKPVAGRVFGRTPADDLVFKQTQRNKIEALIQIALERMSNPVWLIPKSIGIESISGEPGEKIWYNPFVGPGVKPERIPGTELTGSILRWVETIDKDMTDIAGMYDIMKGQAPKGVPTLGGSQLLLERGFARFTDALNSWAYGWMQSRKNRLCIWKEFAHDDRTVAILGKNSKWDVEQFNSASLAGNYTVRIEEGNIAPKSKAYQQMITSQLIEAQLVDITDPIIRHKIMSDFDASHLVEGLDIDIKDAIKEEEEFLSGGGFRPRAGIDNDQIHLMQHVKKAKSDEYFSEWNPIQQQELVGHIQYHAQQIQKQQEEQRQNDPKVLNAKARVEQAQIELEAFQKEKDIELDHQKKRSDIHIQSLGIKEGLKAGMKAATPEPSKNGRA